MVLLNMPKNLCNVWRLKRLQRQMLHEAMRWLRASCYALLPVIVSYDSSGKTVVLLPSSAAQHFYEQGCKAQSAETVKGFSCNTSLFMRRRRHTRLERGMRLDEKSPMSCSSSLFGAHRASEQPAHCHLWNPLNELGKIILDPLRGKRI